ncbi:hypothetical protein FAF44_47420 [Nonomuraea sp. MG754425]|uniref:hypothetical protein n=1 Tax=Nonomuraea sp. MG754425 TaxID=2570319 RepID=UPI001F2783C9|nr:hypothetical protein [Nonomuraea sp. MG754425]MCF6475920.1 hypothetical protein [Nonomuraea sp. MG754425]
MPDLTVPPEVDAVLETIGVRYPNVKTSEILLHRDIWNTVQDGSAKTGTAAETTTAAVSTDYRGESATALAGLYGSPGGALELMSKATSAVEYMPRLLTGAASLTTGVQLAVISGAVYTSARILRTMLMGGPAAGPLTMRELLRGRIAITNVQREGAEGVHRMFRPALAHNSTGRFDDVRRGLPRLDTARGQGVGRDMPGMALMGRKKRNSGDSGGSQGSGGGGTPERTRWWGGSPKHAEGRASQGGRSNAAPSNPQQSLDNSIAQSANTDRRLARDENTGEFVVFDRTRGDEYHGHQRTWDELDNKQQSVLRRAFGLDGKGRPRK